MKPLYNQHKNTGPKGKDLSIFVRFGGLDLKNQNGYSNNPKTFHSPPAPRGIYAFPKVVQEFFLIGSMDSFQPSTTPKGYGKYPDHGTHEEISKWKEGSLAFDHEGHSKRWKISLSCMRKEFRKVDGNIWSHLSEHVRLPEVIDRHGSWVKTSIKEWKRAFNKMSLNNRMPNVEYMSINSINSSRGIAGYYSKDDFEVFFDEKI
jgi:hypothetical protein